MTEQRAKTTNRKGKPRRKSAAKPVAPVVWRSPANSPPPEHEMPPESEFMPAHERFLVALRMLGNVVRACKLASVNRSTMYQHRKEDKDFAAAWDEAEVEGADNLEAEAFRRAMEGVDEPVYWRGMLVDTVRKYSDTLLIFLLKGIKPNKYRDNWKGELSGPNNSPIPMSIDLQIAKVYGDGDSDSSH